MVDLEERFAALQYAKLVKESHSIAQETSRTEHKSVNGLGELTLRVGLSEYLAAHHKYQNLYPGSSCWRDPEFQKAYARDNPHVRVKTTRTTNGQELPKGTLFVPPKYAS